MVVGTRVLRIRVATDRLLAMPVVMTVTIRVTSGRAVNVGRPARIGSTRTQANMVQGNVDRKEHHGNYRRQGNYLHVARITYAPQSVKNHWLLGQEFPLANLLPSSSIAR